MKKKGKKVYKKFKKHMFTFDNPSDDYKPESSLPSEQTTQPSDPEKPTPLPSIEHVQPQETSHEHKRPEGTSDKNMESSAERTHEAEKGASKIEGTTSKSEKRAEKRAEKRLSRGEILDLEGSFKEDMMVRLAGKNEDFLDSSLYEFENYLGLHMVETMFDHNLQFEEFVYIFEDIWNNAEPHTESIERNMREAEDLKDEISQEFLDKLTEL
mmetsp:Transcript_4662/g.7919  ORF Transcript_4662/g.7919 Transcript_4662/m.7919 type:complete len:212 (-) Transcript_4662:504-1139(-)